MPEQHLRRYRVKGIAGRGHLLTERRPEASRPPAQPSRARSWLSAGLAHHEDAPFHQNYAAAPLKEKVNKNTDSALSILGGDADQRSHDRLGEPSPDHIQPHSNRRSALERDKHGHAGANTVEQGGSNDLLPPEQRSLSYDEKNYIAAVRSYRRILGPSDNWKAVVDALMSTPQRKLGMNRGRDEIERPSVESFIEVLYSRPIPTTQHLFRLYRDIPAPGVAKLSKYSRGYLLRRLANPPNRRWADARRYLAVVEDMVTAGLHMSRSFWTSAIYFAGRGTGSGKVKRRDLVRAIGLWQQMEHIAGIPADATVFEILFSVAVKAGQYTVASRLEEEMKSRGLEFGRFGIMTKIFHQGLRKDLHGISESFEKFVKSGEIVDTVVLNCLCASYLRAGETDLAEQLYSRMIKAQVASRKNQSRQENASARSNLSPVEPVLSSDFVIYRRDTMNLGRLLKKSRSLQKHLPGYHRAIQKSLPMTPDTRTFYIFLRHFAIQTGQFDRFMSVLHDMEDTFGVPPRHMIYMLLFEGFGIHGKRMKSWAKRLRLIWHSYLRALHESKARLDGLGKGLKPSKAVWENPLGTGSNLDEEDGIPESDPGDFYMRLPSEDVQDTSGPVEMLDSVGETMPNDASNPIQDDNHVFNPAANETLAEEEKPNDSANMKTSETYATDEQRQIIIDAIHDAYSDLDIDPEVDHGEYLQRRVENGVFVGRSMIILILRAFGACCGPKEVLEAWLQLERLWHSDHRKANDVFAVKEELDRQMSKDPPRPEDVR